jgi:hypothetical protein
MRSAGAAAAVAAANWFEVDKEGLGRLLKRRGMAFVLFELLQNAWDTGATAAEVALTPVEGRPLVKVAITDDDLDGFRNLTHAYTLFASSEKHSDPTKRGRFNLGEKLVLAVCEDARIVSTTGAVEFLSDGSRRPLRRRREQGTSFEATVRMTRDELAEVLAASRTVIAPIPTTVNGEPLPVRSPLKVFEVLLPTEQADAEGYLRRTFRDTEVRVYSRLKDEPARLYEMGIPVVELDSDPFDVEVMQKVPLNAERDNVTPWYLREIRVAVLNAMHAELPRDSAASAAVHDALTSDDISKEAVERVLTLTYGEKRAVFDPSDRQANDELVSRGYKIIHGGAFSADAWENIRAHSAALPAGQIAPTPKPYSNDPNAPMRVLLEEKDWTDGMRNVAAYARALGRHLVHPNLELAITIETGAHRGVHEQRRARGREVMGSYRLRRLP